MFQESYPISAGYRTHAPKSKPLPLRLNGILAEGRAQTNTAHIAQPGGTTDPCHTHTNALASVRRRQVREPATRSSCNFRHGRHFLGSPDFFRCPSNGGSGSTCDERRRPPCVRLSVVSRLASLEQHFRVAPKGGIPTVFGMAVGVKLPPA
jgi:hypothetical protein